MHGVRNSHPNLAGIVPYDPKYLPAKQYLSANENPSNVPEEVQLEIRKALKGFPFNRYPDPLGNELRDLIAEANGLSRENVLLGNGGDELLFNLALTWGGPGRTFLNVPPTFSVYEANARLTGTKVVNVPRKENFDIDEEAVLARMAEGDIDFAVITSPNNPTGKRANETFLKKLLDSSDALIMVDEAYFEFSRFSMRPYLDQYENLVILRTFSKAFSLAGVRMGYLLANAGVIREFLKVRQPYSVDSVSQAIATAVYRNRSLFVPGINQIIEQRGVLLEELGKMPGVTVFDSDSNYVLFRVADADEIWQGLYDRGVLIRDFSHSQYLENCLRNTFGLEGTPIILSIREKGDFLVIWKSQATDIKSGIQLMMTMEDAIRDKLKEKYGDSAYYGKKSLVAAAKEAVNDSSINWDELFMNQSYALYEEYGSVEDFRDEVNAGNLKAANVVARIYRDKGWGFFTSLQMFKDWVGDVIEGNNLQDTGIIFIWDEFTSYLRNNPTDDVLQPLSEFCKEQPFFMFLMNRSGYGGSKT